MAGLVRLVQSLFFVLCRSECAPYDCTQCTTAERGYDKHPEVLEGLAAGEEGGADGTGGVDGSPGKVDAHEVDQDKAETDCETGEIACSNLAVSGTEDHEDEQEGGDDLDKECTTDTTGSGNTVATKTGRICTDEFG